MNMKLKVLLYLLILVIVIVLIISVLSFVNYELVMKYEVEGMSKSIQVINVEDRRTEVKSLIRFLSIVIVSDVLVLISLIYFLFKIPRMK